jgi:2-polyprenyl-3-methyl-5-hydroxy-6-metoxy-1,4-benzoquinol methylase
VAEEVSDAMNTRETLSVEIVQEFFNRPDYLERTPYRGVVRAVIVREMLGALEHARILDLGCGDGSISIPLLGDNNELTLVDFSTRMLGIAAERVPDHQRARVSVTHAAVHEFKPSSPYDVVICLGVLAHVPSIEDALSKIAECLKPGGRAIVELTPDPLGFKKILLPYYALRRVFSKTPGFSKGARYQLNRMDASQLVEIAASRGLTLRSVRRHSFPLPGMSFWPDRWLRRYTLFTLRNRLFSRFGLEHVMLFTRD